MGDEHRISSKKKKNKSKQKEEIMFETDNKKVTNKKSKLKVDKGDKNDDLASLTGETLQKLKTKDECKKEKKKIKDKSGKDQILISDVTNFVSELLDELKNDSENVQSKKRKKIKKKKKHKTLENVDSMNERKVFSDNGSSGTQKKQCEEEVKNMKRSKHDKNNESPGNCWATEMNESGKSNLSSTMEACDGDHINSISLDWGESQMKKKSREKSKGGENKLKTRVSDFPDGDILHDRTGSKKKERKKKKSKTANVDIQVITACENSADDNSENGQKKRKKKKSDIAVDENNADDNSESGHNKRKKKKSDITVGENNADDNSESGQNKRKKKKRSDIAVDENNADDNSESGHNKRKKKKSDIAVDENNADDNSESGHNKRKKKKSDIGVDEDNADDNSESGQKKRKKKKRSDIAVDENTCNADDNSENGQKKKSDIAADESNADDNSESGQKKRKKKKSDITVDEDNADGNSESGQKRKKQKRSDIGVHENNADDIFECGKKKSKKNKKADIGDCGNSSRFTQNTLKTSVKCHSEKKEKSRKRVNDDTDTQDVGGDQNGASCDSKCGKKKKKEEKNNKGEYDSSGQFVPHQAVKTSVDRDSEMKKEKKKKFKLETEMDTRIDSTESVDEEDTTCDSKMSRKRKSEKTDDKQLENEILSTKKKRKDNCANTSTQHLNDQGPVFKSEERIERFKRLLGAKNSRDISSCQHIEALNKKQTPISISKKDENDSVSNGQGTISSSSALSAGQWNGVMFENAERQNKFIRLLGGAKSSAEKKKGLFSTGKTTPKKGLFGSLASKMDSNGPGSVIGGAKALGPQAAAILNQSLEDDYNRALSRRLDGTGSSGIGFVKDPAEGKKFHINTNAVKSTQFSDEDQ